MLFALVALSAAAWYPGAISAALITTARNSGVVHASPVVMAGFGGGGKGKGGAAGGKKRKTKKQPSGVTLKQQWQIFRELRSADNVLTTSVYAKLPEDDAKWMNVGGVIVEAPGSRQQAVFLQKRLILEHAALLHPTLAPRARELICGYSTTGAETEQVEAVVPLEKTDVPDGLRAGFQGLPDPKSGAFILQSGQGVGNLLRRG